MRWSSYTYDLTALLNRGAVIEKELPGILLYDQKDKVQLPAIGGATDFKVVGGVRCFQDSIDSISRVNLATVKLEYDTFSSHDANSFCFHEAGQGHFLGGFGGLVYEDGLLFFEGVSRCHLGLY